MIVEYEEEYFTKTAYIPYENYPSHKRRATKLVRMTSPASVLDVGCAYGYIVRHLLDMGIYAVGMDISKWCEKQSEKIIPNNFVRHDLREKLPFRNKEFDVLYCEGVLEHIEEDRIPDIMAEFNRVSKNRVLAISLSDYPNAKDAIGHVCSHDHIWWYEIIPPFTWLYLGVGATDEDTIWMYKG